MSESPLDGCWSSVVKLLLLAVLVGVLVCLAATVAPLGELQRMDEQQQHIVVER